MGVKTFFRRLKNKHAPSAHQLMLRKWRGDGGDYRMRFEYDLNAESVVIDLGGYEGQWASDLYSRYACQLFVFEPVHDFSKRIKDRFANNDSIKVFDFGLGATTRVETIHVSADGSSVFGNSRQTQLIKVVDVKEWMNQQGIGCIDLMKINIEGGEYELLNRLLETDLIQQINNIQVQFHDVSASSRDEMQQLQSKIALTHHPTYQYEFVWENWVRNAA